MSWKNKINKSVKKQTWKVVKIVVSIVKRNEKWYYSVELGTDQNGKRKRKRVYGFNSKREAQEAAHELLIQLNKDKLNQN
jgi:hypothetical protein